MNVCRLCCSDDANINLEEIIEIDDNEGNVEHIDTGNLIYQCLDMNIPEIDANFPHNPKSICNECIETLRNIYKYKSTCSRNNEMYFMQETVFIEEEEEEVAVEVYKEEEEPTYIIEELKEDVDEQQKILYELQSSHLEIDDRKKLNNRKNALRQRLKRMNETPEEKEQRRKKVAEQTRRRRELMRQRRPDLYLKILDQVAERKRVKRKMMTEEEKAILRAKEAEAARIRRNQLSQEQKELLKKRNREQARARRSKSISVKVEEVVDDNNMWGVIESHEEFNEC